MKQLLLSATMLITLAFSACNQKPEQKTEMAASTEEKSKTLEVKVSDLATNKDFVCGMEVSDGGISDTASYEGKLYGFCSVECKDEFVKNPASFLAQK